MSCRGKDMHALGECDCYFKPLDFLVLLDKEHDWLELLLRLTHRRAIYSEGIENEAISLMLRHRARWLRN
jgi:hypothetical protein